MKEIKPKERKEGQNERKRMNNKGKGKVIPVLN
jgi:hypothetical protein